MSASLKTPTNQAKIAANLVQQNKPFKFDGTKVVAAMGYREKFVLHSKPDGMYLECAVAMDSRISIIGPVTLDFLETSANKLARETVVFVSREIENPNYKNPSIKSKRGFIVGGKSTYTDLPNGVARVVRLDLDFIDEDSLKAFKESYKNLANSDKKYVYLGQ